MIYSLGRAGVVDCGMIPPYGNQGIAHKDKNAVFVYDRLDRATRGRDLDASLLDEWWESLRITGSQRLLINYTDDYFNIRDVEEWKETLTKRQIPMTRVIFIVKDQLFEDFIQRNFEDMRGYEIFKYGLLQQRITWIHDTDVETKYKFSVLSRNYNRERLKLYLELFDKGILDETIYSFHNINPYQLDDQDKHKTFTHQEMINDLRLIFDTKANPRFTNAKYTEGPKYPLTFEQQNWLRQIPYDLPMLNNPLDKWSGITEKAILMADFHVLIESHYDPFMNYERQRSEYSVEEFSPGFATEKAYKVINCSRPFLAYTTPYFMKEMRQAGFKTFNPYIDESYDIEEDDIKRRDMIVAEMKRIQSLNETEYAKLKNACVRICEHNKQELLRQNRVDQQYYRKHDILKHILPNFKPYWDNLENKNTSYEYNSQKQNRIDVEMRTTVINKLNHRYDWPQITKILADIKLRV